MSNSGSSFMDSENSSEISPDEIIAYERDFVNADENGENQPQQIHTYEDIGQEGETECKLNRRLSRILTTGYDSGDQPYSITYQDCPPMGGGKPYPPLLPERYPWEVTFDGPFDPLHPHNWSLRKRVFIVSILSIDCMCVTMGSASFASAIPQIEKQFGVIQVVGVLGLTFYVLGFAVAPIIYGPLSELYGRQYILIISAFGFALFQFAVATGENLQTILICRFFGGAMGAAPLAVIPAAMGDMFNNKQRGTVISIFALCVFLGPILTPVYTSYIVQHTTWRWTQYTIGIFAVLVFFAITFFYEETHHPIILTKKAARMRKQTGNWGIYSSQEIMTLSIRDIVTKTITRPLRMLVREPILLFLTLYNSFVYGILYLLLEAYPIVFREKYHFTKNGQIPYIALVVGMITFCLVMVFYYEPKYVAKVVKNKGKSLPEERLKPMMVSAFIFPIGILWFCWTGNYGDKIHFMVPTVAGAFIGYGLIGIFLTSFNYIIDSYLLLTASAIAANTFLRSGFGAAFPLFASYMFHGMGTNWAGMVLGMVSVVLIPVPFLFYKYGARIRLKSKYAYSA